MPKPLRAFATPVGCVIKPMYKSPCCGTELSWNDVRKSYPLRPIKCPDCGRELHGIRNRKSPWLNFFVILIVFPVVVLIDIYFQTKSHVYILPALFIFLLIAWIAEEIYLVKKGDVIETTSKHKRIFKRQLIIFGVLVFVSIGYYIERAL